MANAIALPRPGPACRGAARVHRGRPADDRLPRRRGRLARALRDRDRGQSRHRGCGRPPGPQGRDGLARRHRAGQGLGRGAGRPDRRPGGRQGRRPRRGGARPWSSSPSTSARASCCARPSPRSRPDGGPARQLAQGSLVPRQDRSLHRRVAHPLDRAAADLRQRRQERRVQAPGRVQAPRLDPDPPRAPQPLDQPRGPLPVPGERTDDLGDGLHRPAHADEAEPHPGRGRGRLRRDQEQHHGHEPLVLLRGQVVPLPRDPVLLHRLLEHHRLPAAADQQRRDHQHLRGRASHRSRSTPRRRTSRSPSRSPWSSGSATTSRESGRRGSSATCGASCPRGSRA